MVKLLRIILHHSKTRPRFLVMMIMLAGTKGQFLGRCATGTLNSETGVKSHVMLSHCRFTSHHLPLSSHSVAFTGRCQGITCIINSLCCPQLVGILYSLAWCNEAEFVDRLFCNLLLPQAAKSKNQSRKQQLHNSLWDVNLVSGVCQHRHSKFIKVKYLWVWHLWIWSVCEKLTEISVVFNEK